MPDTTNSPNSDGLAQISEWSRKYHQRLKPARSISKLKKDFIEEKIRLIKDRLQNCDISLLSIRSSFRKGSDYLLPVYSSIDGTKPTEILHTYFSDSNKQNPFSFKFSDKRSRKKVFADLCCAYHENGGNLEDGANPIDSGDVFVAFHQNLERAGSGEFTKRIYNFWNELKSSDLDKSRKNSDSTDTNELKCLFAGRRKSSLTPGKISLDHLFVLYFTGDRLEDSNLFSISKIAKDLFTGLDLIHDIDASIFRSESLALVKKLIPLFAEEDIAPADKIAFAVEQLKKLLGTHLIGRNAVRNEDGSDKAPDIFYLSTVFERCLPTKVFPRLEVYPNAYRLEHPKTSLRLSHVGIPSLSKALLLLYSGEKNLISIRSAAANANKKVTLVTEFKRKAGITDSHVSLVKALGTAWKKELPDQISLSSHDHKGLWKDLYLKFDDDSSANVNSFAGFIVEGEKVPNSQRRGKENRCLPHGIFAVESKIEEAFSDQDLESLQRVFSGIGSLIRDTFHHHSPIDFRSSLAEIHENTLHVEPPEQQGTITKELDVLLAKSSRSSTENKKKRELTNKLKQFKKLEKQKPLKNRLGLIVQKIDGKQLNKVVDKIDYCLENKNEEEKCEYLKLYHLDSNSYEAVKKIASIVINGIDAEDDVTSDAALERRFRDLRETLRELNLESALTLLNDAAVEFLEACTENFQWSNYITSMSQILGDRLMPDGKDISFQIMTPGYSASSMYLAKKTGEIQQVVKLSSKEKLEIERTNYTRHVRFKLMHAARMGKRAFAFDSTGETGKTIGKAHDLTENIETDQFLNPKSATLKSKNYGALVSDLISSSQTNTDWALTLHRIAHHYALDGETLSNPPEVLKLEAALEEVLNKGRVLWEDSEESFSDRPSSFRIVETITRIREAKDKKDEFMFFLSEKKPIDINSIRSKLLDVEPNIEEGCLIGNSNSPTTLKTWIHGDMNGKNLTWADAFDSFFMIDFEHVKLGIKGADRLRLSINLFIDLVEEAKWNEDPRTDPATAKVYCTPVGQGIQFFSSIVSALKKGKFLPDAVKSSLSKIQNVEVQKIISAILNELPRPNSLNKTDKNWGNFWIYYIICTIAKEYQYTCRGPGFEDRKHLLEAQYPNLGNLESAIDSIVKNDRIPPLDYAQCIKHLFVRKLLSECFKKIDLI